MQAWAFSYLFGKKDMLTAYTHKECLMSHTKVFKSDNSIKIRNSKQFRFNSGEVKLQKSSDVSNGIREKSASSASYPNVFVEVLSRQRQDDEPCPDISDFIAGDKEVPKEII